MVNCSFTLVSQTPLETHESEYKNLKGSEAISHLFRYQNTPESSCRIQSFKCEYFVKNLKINSLKEVLSLGCVDINLAIASVKSFDQS